MHNWAMDVNPLQLADALGHEVSDKRLDILRRIDAAGSISEAARGAGLSYKAAWQAIDTLSNLAGVALLERTVGGAGGGGARLSPAGKELIRAAQMFADARARVLAQLAGDANGPSVGVSRVVGLHLRTSMRNQFPCRVTGCSMEGDAMIVALALVDGTPLYSRITQESWELLALKPGAELVAMCKATAVAIVPKSNSSANFNHFAGRIRRPPTTELGEASLELACGVHLVGFSGPSFFPSIGDTVSAHFSDAAVVIVLAN